MLRGWHYFISEFEIITGFEQEQKLGIISSIYSTVTNIYCDAKVPVS